MQIPKIIEVQPKEDMILLVRFDNEQIKEIDIKPYLETFHSFTPLLNKNLFNKVKVDVGGFGIVWNEEIDLSRYDIWKYGV